MLSECTSFHESCREFDRDVEAFLRSLTRNSTQGSLEPFAQNLRHARSLPQLLVPKDDAAENGESPSASQRTSALSHVLFLQQQLLPTAELDPVDAQPLVDARSDALAPAVRSHSEQEHKHADIPVVPDSGPAQPAAVEVIDWEGEAAAALERGEWKSAVDKRGRTYFMNKRERVTVWNLAKELKRRGR